MSKQIVFSALLVAASVAATRYYWPAVRTQTVVQEKEVIRKDVRTIIREVVRPDGSKETTTEIVDRSKQDNSSSHTVSTYRANWQAAVTAKADLSNLQPVYGVQVGYRVLGPAWVGVGISTDKTVTAFVGFEF